jgi:hypothetical protein
MSAKFDALAAKVGSGRLAGWITQHNPKVRARAEATKAKKRARDVMRTGKSSK